MLVLASPAMSVRQVEEAGTAMALAGAWVAAWVAVGVVVWAAAGVAASDPAWGLVEAGVGLNPMAGECQRSGTSRKVECRR